MIDEIAGYADRIKNKQLKLVKKLLWRKIFARLDNQFKNIKFLYLLEMKMPWNECIVETIFSILKRVYNDNYKMSHLKKLLKRVLLLSKNNKQRRITVKCVSKIFVYLHHCSAIRRTKNYDKHKRCKTKAGKVIDKRNNWPTDDATSVECVKFDFFKTW